MKHKTLSLPMAVHLAVATVLAAGTNMSVALAQTAEDSTVPPGGLEEVVVTSQRRVETLQEVPMAISAFTLNDVQSAAIHDTQSLSLKVPGLVYLASDGFAQPYIRGVGMAFAANGLETPIATYIDDVYIQQQTGSITQLVDLERVEVLKGPQGTLYGRNATGGAIVVRTADPTDEFEGSFKLGYGNFGTVRSEGVLNVPLSDTLSARFAGQLDYRTEGYIKNQYTGNELGQDRRVTGRAKLAWRPSDDTEVIASIEVFRGDDENNAHRQADISVCTACTVYGLTPPSGFYNVFLNTETQAQNDANLGIVRVSHDFGSLNFNSVTSFRTYTFSGSFDQDFTSANLLNYVTHNESETFEQELRLASDLDGPLNFTSGVFYEHDYTNAPASLPGDAFGTLLAGSDRTASKLKAASVFGEVYYDFTDQWKLTLGGRYNRDQRSLEVRNNADGAIAFGTPGFEVDKTFTDFTPRAVIAFNDGDVNLYASYGEGFKSGGFNSVVFTQPDPLKSEKLNGFEIGGKFALFGHSVRLNTSAFHYSYDDMQVTFYDPLTSATFLRNAADATIYGADLDLTWATTDALTLGFGGAYLHATFDSFPNGSVYLQGPGTYLVDVADLSGSPLPNAPKLSGYVSANYTQPISAGLELNLGAIANYSDSYDFLPAAGGPLGLDKQDSLTRVNATASIGPSDGRWTFSLWVENLTDEEYYNNRLATGFGDQLTMALPRTYGGSVQVRF